VIAIFLQKDGFEMNKNHFEMIINTMINQIYST